MRIEQNFKPGTVVEAKSGLRFTVARHPIRGRSDVIPVDRDGGGVGFLFPDSIARVISVPSNGVTPESLDEAIEYGDTIQIVYTKKNGEKKTRLIVPQEVTTTQAGDKLLLANDVERGDIRTFRLDRIESFCDRLNGDSTVTRSNLNISRKKLVDLAFQVIERDSEGVSTNNRNHLLYAACTVPKIALGSWVIDKTCGCLVGSAYLAAAKDDELDLDWDPETDGFQEDGGILASSREEAEALVSLGILFDDLLRYELESKGGEVPANAPVEVIG